jgi:hypothetical protein
LASEGDGLASVAGLFHLVTAGSTIIGETWVYYILGTVVELLLLLAIVRVAWTWPRNPIQ